VDASRLDRMQGLLRDKLDMYAAGASGSFHLRSTFRYFDRDAQGAISFDEFKHGLSLLGFAVGGGEGSTSSSQELEGVALFARYDVQQRGFLDYYEFIEHVMGRDYISDLETKALGVKVQALLDILRSGSSGGGGGGGGPEADAATSAAASATVTMPFSPRDVASVDVQALSDESFMARQKVRRVFASLDKDSSGHLDEHEFSRLLAIIGVHASAAERQAIFNFVAKLSLPAGSGGGGSGASNTTTATAATNTSSASRWSRPKVAAPPQVTFDGFYKWYGMDLSSKQPAQQRTIQGIEPARGGAAFENTQPNFSTVTFREE
jgi:Ca2+-binding EF-hand superfamily protein